MKIYGNIIGNPVPMPDWAQDDSTAPDFIKNKPQIVSPEELEKLHLVMQVAVPASGWSLNGGVYTQTVLAAGIGVNDHPIFGVVYSGTADEKKAQKEAFALVDDLDSQEDSIVLSCFEEAPKVDLTLLLEVNR